MNKKAAIKATGALGIMLCVIALIAWKPAIILFVLVLLFFFFMWALFYRIFGGNR